MKFPARPWRITWLSHSWTDDDLSTAHAIAAQAIANDGWSSIDPWAGPAQLATVIAVLLAGQTTTDATETLAVVAMSPLADLLSAIEEREAAGESDGS